MLPWGAQCRNLSTAEGRAWVSACLDGDHQLREARRLAQCALTEVGGDALCSTATLLAYSDGSVLAEGIEGSAAAIVCINGREVCAIIRLASADRALSSGRAEWGGLVMVLYIAQDIPCEIVLRLDNLQVVNAFNDGPLRYEYDWLRRNDKDMATLAWELDAARRAKGFGGLRAVHQLGHPEKREKASEYDQHEKLNVKVDALTHCLTDEMPLYVSFKRQARRQTQLWYEPLYEENVGHGTSHEVTSDVYRHIAKSALRRTSIRRLQRNEGDF